MLRWSTGGRNHACALLVRDPSTGQEVERPYHEGMEQQLPERFKVKFVARMYASEDPIASVPPGRSFLFLHPYMSKGSMSLLGVVEEARLVERSAHAKVLPHVYHLDVRRVQGQGEADATFQGIRADAGAAFGNTLVQLFGLTVAQANVTPATLGNERARHVLHLPGGTPQVPA